MGDWNISMEQPVASQFGTMLDGVLKRPVVDVTCTTASETSLIEYAMIKRGFEHNVTIRACGQVPWKTHVGLELEIDSGHDQ